MEDWVFEKIINELAAAGFGKHRTFWPKPSTENFNVPPTYFRSFTENQPVLSFLGYMEPMADIKNFKTKLNFAIDHLPEHVEFLSNTNGDYIKKENLEGLYLTTLNIMDYDRLGKEYWTKKLSDEGCLIIEDENIDFRGVLAVNSSIGVIKVNVDWPDYHQLENRAGALNRDDDVIREMKWRNEVDERIVPCPEPTYYMNITFDGNVMPCCHLRSDIPIHQDYILGNVKNNTLEEIYNSPKALEFRQRLVNERGDYPDPCKNCQKIRPSECTGAPNGMMYLGRRYQGNVINESVKFL